MDEGTTCTVVLSCPNAKDAICSSYPRACYAILVARAGLKGSLLKITTCSWRQAHPDYTEAKMKPRLVTSSWSGSEKQLVERTRVGEPSNDEEYFC